MVQLSGSLEPVAGERLWNALRRETNRVLAANGGLVIEERLSEEQATARALVNLVAGGHAAKAGPNATDLVVLVGLEHFTGEPDGQQACETARGTRLPVDWVRRMAHEAKLIPLVIDEAGLAVELDRVSRQRLASFVQRVMLRATYDTCFVDWCDVPFEDCEIHHLVPFNGHNTTLGNLRPACSRHHHRIHDDGWQIELDDQGDVTIRLPDGTLWAEDEYRPPGSRAGPGNTA